MLSIGLMDDIKLGCAKLHFEQLMLSLIRVWVPFTLLYRVNIHQNKCASSYILDVKLGVCDDSESIASICFAPKTWTMLKTDQLNCVLVMSHHFSLFCGGRFSSKECSLLNEEIQQRDEEAATLLTGKCWNLAVGLSFYLSYIETDMLVILSLIIFFCFYLFIVEMLVVSQEM